MKNVLISSIFLFLPLLNLQAQDSIPADMKRLVVECQIAENKKSLMEWTENGLKLNCIDESGYMSIKLNDWLSVDLQQLYKATSRDVLMKFNTPDFYVKSIQIDDFEKHTEYIVDYKPRHSAEGSNYQMTKIK